MRTQPVRFQDFYQNVFLAEHQNPANVALHVLGTVLGIAVVAWAWASSSPWLVLAFPVVHAAPGLIGHRLFERSAAVGDIRVMRRDHPPLWFIAANHCMAFELLVRGFHWRGAASGGK
jgi:hypothetical protein